jgi:hypothetical protein
MCTTPTSVTPTLTYGSPFLPFIVFRPKHEGKTRMQYICNSVHDFYTAILDHHQHHITVNVLRQLRNISIVYIQQFCVHSKVGLHSAYNPKKEDETDSTHHKMYNINQFCSQCIL